MAQAHSHDNHLDHDYEQEHSFDLVARVRAAKEAAQREMETFGDVAEYEIRKIFGQRSDLNYNDESATAPGERPVQVRNHDEDSSAQSASSGEAEKAQASFDFNGSQPMSAKQDEEG
jgi:hypothetical protein